MRGRSGIEWLSPELRRLVSWPLPSVKLNAGCACPDVNPKASLARTNAAMKVDHTCGL